MSVFGLGTHRPTWARPTGLKMIHYSRNDVLTECPRWSQNSPSRYFVQQCSLWQIVIIESFVIFKVSSQYDLVPALKPNNGWGEKEEDEDSHKISHKIQSWYSGMKWDSLILHRTIFIQNYQILMQSLTLRAAVGIQTKLEANWTKNGVFGLGNSQPAGASPTGQFRITHHFV